MAAGSRARDRPSIVANSTVSGIGHAAQPHDPLASQRTELLGSLAAAQFDLERAITELMQSGADVGAAQSQLLKIGQLMRTIGSADAHALVAMQANVAGLVGEAQAMVQKGRELSNVGESLAAVDARTRATVQRISADLFERKIFDPYLRFDTAEAEEAYRQREAERQEYVRRELAKGTSEGALNANAAALEQIKDAGVHGADRSPDYERLLNEAKIAESSLRSTSREATPNATQPDTPPTPQDGQDEFGDILATLRDAGVVTAVTASPNPAHGLTAAKAATSVREV